MVKSALIPYCTSNHTIIIDCYDVRFLAAVSVKKIAAAVIRTCGRR